MTCFIVGATVKDLTKAAMNGAKKIMIHLIEKIRLFIKEDADIAGVSLNSVSKN